MSPRRHPRPDDFTTSLGGNLWSVKFVRRCDIPKDRLGDCNWDRKRIRVRFDLDEQMFIDVLIHELRHALSLQDYHSEDWVEFTSTELAEAISKAGIGRKS
jgi:hypothetical protein